MGSIAPDFEMFLRMKALIRFSHTWHSVFWFNLPLAILLAFLFHLVVRNSLLNHLPLFLRKRLAHFKSFDWTHHFRQNTLVVIVSVLIGVASHLFWDNFTHQYGIFLQWFPILAKEVALGAYQMRVYYLLQLVFSVIGGLAVLYAVLRLPAKDSVAQQNKPLLYWALVSFITLLIAAVRFMTGLDFSYVPNLIVVLISGGLMSLLLVPLLIKGRQ